MTKQEHNIETQTNVILFLSPEKAESDSSHYESYDEEDDDDGGEELVKDRAHYIRWSASQPCLKPTPESRLCGYLWRRKWLGQWSKELFIIRNDVLLVRNETNARAHTAAVPLMATRCRSIFEAPQLFVRSGVFDLFVPVCLLLCLRQCYKCARDLLPQLELNLRGCQLVYKSKSSRKIQHQLKLVLLGSETLVLGYSTFQQADEWKKVSNTRHANRELAHIQHEVLTHSQASGFYIRHGNIHELSVTSELKSSCTFAPESEISCRVDGPFQFSWKDLPRESEQSHRSWSF